MLTQKAAEMLAVFFVIEAAKDAVEKFEGGEISASEAVRLIREAAARLKAA